MTDKVLVERNGPVTTIIINRPKYKNALDNEAARALGAAFRAFEADPRAQVAVLTGAGGAFCAGADLKELGSGTDYFPWAGSDEGPLRGWRSIHVSDGDHPYVGHWWVPGLQIGYEHSFVHQMADFLQGLETGKPAMPDFRDALRTQYVCDAVLQSAKDGKWRSVEKA